MGTIMGSMGADNLKGTDLEEGDMILLLNGADIADGGMGADTIMGGEGDDQLNGSFQNDYLAGDIGADTLNGDSGDDLHFTRRTLGSNPASGPLRKI